MFLSNQAFNNSVYCLFYSTRIIGFALPQPSDLRLGLTKVLLIPIYYYHLDKYD